MYVISRTLSPFHEGLPAVEISSFHLDELMGEFLAQLKFISVNGMGHTLQGMLILINQLIVELGRIVLVNSVSSIAERLLLEPDKCRGVRAKIDSSVALLPCFSLLSRLGSGMSSLIELLILRTEHRWIMVHGQVIEDFHSGLHAQ